MRRDSPSGPRDKAPRRSRPGVLGFLVTPFGLAVLACLGLAGWALWSGGVVDGPMARQVRTSSVYAAPGTGLDVTAAERVIGNRRLVVLLLPADTEPRTGCDKVRRTAAGTLVLGLSRTGTEYDTYSCALLPGVSDENFGRALVAETTVARGVDQFADRPLEAVKLVVVNYDMLVRANIVPDGARTVSPSLPRYLVAGAAVLIIILGSVLLWAAGRRAGRAATDRRDRIARATDARTALTAATAVFAQQIIDLDARYQDGPDSFRGEYRKLTSDHLALLDRVPHADDAEAARLTAQVETLIDRARKLS
ncbi:hypothetical protein [Actinoplanes sp. NPDC051494]|uniref:hypothetical protein n=1 Tax=Actinoplanes sp. NPDC051494 TaxID=3363907 RepID=UPI0037BCD981